MGMFSNVFNWNHRLDGKRFFGGNVAKVHSQPLNKKQQQQQKLTQDIQFISFKPFNVVTTTS